MEKGNIDDYEIIDLDELIEKAISHKKIDCFVVDKILSMNHDNATAFKEFIETKVIDFDGENYNDDLQLPIDQFKENLSVKSNNISKYMAQNPATDIENNNLLLVKGKQKLNDQLSKEGNFNGKDKFKHKKEIQKVKILLLVTGLFIVIALFILSFFANYIEKFVQLVSDKITGASNKTESEHTKKISQFIVFVIGFAILTVFYFILKYCFKSFLLKMENQQINSELLILKNQKVNLDERLNNFKTNIDDIKAKRKMFERLVFIFLKLVYCLLIILILLNAFKIKLTALLASAGIITLVITMAAQVILIDYFSGIIYFFENYYNTGEIVKINDIVGKITFANIKRIGIESFSGEQHFILHSQIKHIVNYSKSANKALIIVDISYHNDIRKCIAILQNYLNDTWTQNSSIKLAPIVNGVVQFSGTTVKIEIEAAVEKEAQWEVEKWMKLNVIEILKKNEIKTA